MLSCHTTKKVIGEFQFVMLFIRWKLPLKIFWSTIYLLWLNCIKTIKSFPSLYGNQSHFMSYSWNAKPIIKLLTVLKWDIFSVIIGQSINFDCPFQFNVSKGSIREVQQNNMWTDSEHIEMIRLSRYTNIVNKLKI